MLALTAVMKVLGIPWALVLSSSAMLLSDFKPKACIKHLLIRLLKKNFIYHVRSAFMMSF